MGFRVTINSILVLLSMMNIKIIAIVLVAILGVAAVGIYIVTGDEEKSYHPNTAGQEITDAVGRTVVVPDTLENGIVTIGSSGPLRFLSCFDVFELVIETDKGDVTDSRNGRAYSYAYPFYNLTEYHADNALESGTVESIANKNPSLIVVQESIWTNYGENCRALATKCTLIVIKSQSMTTMWNDNYDLSKDMQDTFNLLGTILGKEDRAKELINGIGGILKDLRSYIKTSDKNVYIAGVTINGSNTFNTTFPTYMPLKLIDGNNAYTEPSTESRVTINVEKFATMDIDIIAIDPSSSDKMAESDNQLALEYVYKVNNDGSTANDIKLYVTVPIVWDSINYDCSLASAYYLTYLLYGGLTHDQVISKINNIFKVFYGNDGSNVLNDMSEFFVKKSSDNNVEMPILEEVKIVESGGKYFIMAV